MPVWRCPHCGTPQAETSRCWVCQRSTTSCATCRSFRRGIAGGLGLCGLDPRRLALRGTEIRACWIARDAADEAPPVDPLAASSQRPAAEAPSGSRTFVPVDELDHRQRGAGADEPDAGRAAVAGAQAVAAGVGAWSLWGDPEA